MKFAHIINPVKVPSHTGLGVAQQITFESIHTALKYTSGRTDVSIYAVCFKEDREVIPGWVHVLPTLEQSVLDLGTFSSNKKYPLLTDVLNAVGDTDADFIIFSNMDISLQPFFYDAVRTILLRDSLDALVVNRRGIPTSYNSLNQMPLMFAEPGMPHPGFDCFIFSKKLLPELVLANVCVGVSFSEVSLMHNLIAFAKKIHLEDNLRLTFHIGTEVMPPLDPEFYNHNRKEYEQKIYPAIKHLLVLHKFPYVALPFHKRMLKWMLNPSFRTHQMAEMEGKNLLRRIKYRLDSIRFAVMDRLR